MPIRVLPQSLVNRIAAGEVVERPASVVKEMVENALDAGATRVTVEVEGAGRRVIRVVDDGAGIPQAELALAVASHATSKLPDDVALFRIETLGFRGEALASIAAVSRLRLASRPRGVDGAEILVDGGVAGEVRAAGVPPGTVVEVRDLFFNTPARAKFLRSDGTEAARITEAVVRLALTRPEVRFDLSHDSRRVLALAPADGLRGRVAQVHGPELAEALLEVAEDGQDLGVRLMLAPAAFARPDRERQYVSLNRRPVRDRTVGHAVSEAYSRFLEHGRHPVFFVDLTVDPSRVDVNVHPTKQEVRLADARRVHEVLSRAARAALGATGGETGGRLDIGGRVEEAIADFYRTGPPSQGPPAAAPVHRTADIIPEGVGRVMQVHRSYVVCEVTDGIEVVDPHALHERVLLEEFRSRVRSRTLAIQRLLVPARVPADPMEVDLAARHQDLLAACGLEVEPFGDGTLAVRAVPALLADRDPEVLIRGLLVETASGDPADLADRVLAGLACRGAVRFGQEIPETEIRRLLARRKDTEGAFSCAHGRPTALKLTLADLDRQFRR